MSLAACPSPTNGPVVVGRILLYADDYVAGWMAERMGEKIDPPYTAFGLVSAHGQLSGAMLFNGFHEGSVEVSLVAPKAVSRSLLRVAARHAFDELGCNRITARTRASSLRVRSFIEKVGFRQEGVLRAYYRDGDDAILFGMLKTENRW
jgi:ribosomal protein S18 acetylase RimI-like enzyme